MAWIELHQSLTTHKKTRRLARALGLGVPEGIPQAIGHLCMFWLWCVDGTDDGSLADLDAQDIADAAGWTGDPRVFADAMCAAEFIDKGPDGIMAIHDWDDYIGRLIRLREETKRKEKMRKREYRERKKAEAQQPESQTTGQYDDYVDPEWLKVVTAYEDNIGMFPVGKTCEMIQTYVDDLTADVVVEGIRCTNSAQPKNPWTYLKRILDEWARLGITTVEKAKANEKDWERAKEQDRRQKKPAAYEPPAIEGDFY